MSSKRVKRTKVYVVCGHNTDWGHTILGIYPNEFTAQYRVDELKEKFAYESIWWTSFETGPQGIDLDILIR